MLMYKDLKLKRIQKSLKFHQMILHIGDCITDIKRRNNPNLWDKAIVIYIHMHNVSLKIYWQEYSEHKKDKKSPI
jgi:hypothetical protein